MSETIKKLTLEEKARLVGGETFFATVDMSQHDIPKLQFLDGGPGLNFEQLFGEFRSRVRVYGLDDSVEATGRMMQKMTTDFYNPEVLSEAEMELRDWLMKKLGELTGGEPFAPGCFPAGILLGATWSPEAVYDVADALGKEGAAYGISLLLGTPNVNLMRDPRNGRLFESFSEDPYLMTQLAPQMVKGVQDNGVAANVKHFAANNQESFRVGVSETISSRALEEMYFPAFHACVDAGVATVMSAYNSINGVPCTENYWLLTEKLREEWGFDGMVVSDWGAVYHPAEAIAAGNDLAMPGPVDPQPVIDAVESGRLPLETLEKAVERVLRFTEKWKRPEVNPKPDIALSDKAAYNAVIEGAVMLKNSSGIFPLSGKTALFGEGAKQFFDCGTGSAGITTDRTGCLIDELSRTMGAENVVYGEITDDTDNVLIVVRQIGMEGNDRRSIMLPEDERQMLIDTIGKAKAAGKKTGVILNVCGPVDCREFIDDTDGMFCVFLPGMGGAAALADLLAGNANPSGRLPVTFPLCIEDTPTYLNFPGDGKHVIYGEDIFVGYRYYDKKHAKTLFPFGYGLSYTTFGYSGIRVSAESFTDEVTVYVDVTNTGDRAGKTVVSLYVSDVVSTIRKPEKELRGFRKIELQPGETQTVSFTVTKKMLASYDADLGCWESDEGYYDFIIANSAEEIIDTVRVYGDWRSAYSFTADTPIKALFEDERVRPLLFAAFEELSLDIGAIYDNYEYNSFKPFSVVLREAGAESIPDSFTAALSEIRRD